MVLHNSLKVLFLLLLLLLKERENRTATSAAVVLRALNVNFYEFMIVSLFACLVTFL